MDNERTILGRFAVLQHLPDVPESVQAQYEQILTLARRADELGAVQTQIRKQQTQIRKQLESAAAFLNDELERIWSPLQLAAARSHEH